MLDARSINGHYWVFYGALSNVEYELTVTDTVSGRVASYHNPSGVFASQGDVEALPGNGSVTPMQPTAVVTGTPAGLGPARGTTQGCVETATRLCLGSGRFSVEVAWEDFDGNNGAGIARPLTADTGTFWLSRRRPACGRTSLGFIGSRCRSTQ